MNFDVSDIHFENIWQYVFLGHIQNTTQLLVYIGIFTLLTAPPLIELFHVEKIQSHSSNSVIRRRERFLFWRNVLLIPFLSAPILFFLHASGVTQLATDVGVSTILWQFVLGIILHDAYFYWTHRIMHYPAFFRTVHAVHHTFVNPTVYASHAFDVWEVIINFTYVIYLSVLLQVMFGQVSAQSILLFLAFANLFNMYVHSGHELVPQAIRSSTIGSWLVWVGYHDLHHEKNNGNFGLYFTFWDRVCGTLSYNWNLETGAKHS